MSIDAERTALRLEQFEHRAKEAELQVAEARLEISQLRAENQVLRDKERATVRVARYSLWQRVAEIFGAVLLLLISTFPLRVVVELVGNLAGKEAPTANSFRIVILFAVVLCVCSGVLLIQSRLRKRKIKTQRLRMDELEKELEAKSPPNPKAGP
ncbi:hypothetical protein AB0F72_35430 [Actinoplanes sp. NPDC023936]|uniref:hypothetical protein n=1 Tax=Actinoplanes sp. NPDC023936 TaxID=3154910 RepID=UPI0033D539A3